MSSLVRARSLRKPAGPTALHPPRERPGDPIPDPNRNGSPSRLPTKPTSRPTSSARAAGTTATAGLSRSTSVRLNRPGSSSSTASSSAAAAPTIPKRSVSLGKKTAPATSAQGTAAASPARKDAHRYPPLSSATRPSSMVLRPTPAGSAATAPTATRRTAPTHARANSTAALGTARRPTTQPWVALQDQKSKPQPPSRGSASASPAAPSTPRQRAVSADKQPPPSTPAAATGKTPRLRALNPLQQRLSPGKPTTPRPPSPSKPPAAVAAAAAAETARQQAALVQLHLLHCDAGRVEAQWHASAKSKLGARFRGLRDAHSALAEREAAAVEADNVEALECWTAARRGPPLDERVRALDAAMSGVWAMSEPGGKYARAVRRFERWFERVMDLEEARDSGTIGLLVGGGRHHGSIGGGGGGGVEEALFAPRMDPAWAEDCAAMARKLEVWQCQLDDAGGDDDLRLAGSDGTAARTTLGRMLEGARSLVSGMLAELAAMEEIRQAALAREEDWIEAMNRDDDEDDMGRRAGAVWRAL